MKKTSMVSVGEEFVSVRDVEAFELEHSFELVECDSNGIVLLTHQHLLPGLQHAQAAGQLVDVVPVQKLLLDLADFRHLARHEEMTGTSRRFRYVGRISSTVVVRLPVDYWWIAFGLPLDCRWFAAFVSLARSPLSDCTRNDSPENCFSLATCLSNSQKRWTHSNVRLSQSNRTKSGDRFRERFGDDRDKLCLF